jgi:hypothetical protein
VTGGTPASEPRLLQEVVNGKDGDFVVQLAELLAAFLFMLRILMEHGVEFLLQGCHR